MKRIIVILGVICAALTSNAAYLYWQVTQDDVPDNVANYNYIRLSYTYEEGGVTKQGKLATLKATNSGKMENVISTSLADLQNGVQYSIFVELMNFENDKWNQVGVSTEQITYTAGATSSASYIDSGSSPVLPVSAEAWHGGSINVPEPTSGVLVMAGFAFLALKRRKV